MHHLRKLAKRAPQLLICITLTAAVGLTAVASVMARAAAHKKVHAGILHGRVPSCPGHGQRSRAHGCGAPSHPRNSGGTPPRPPAKVKVKKAHVSAPADVTAAPAGAAATIASVLASSCQNTELLPEAADLAELRAAVLCLINVERAQNGVAPLRANPELEAAAEGHATELIQDDYFAHISPSGETPVQRIRGTGYIPSPDDGYVIGENLAWGTYELATPKAIVAAWIASPEHLANILEAQYVDTGIGVAPAVPSSLAAGAPGATYAEEFGVIIP